MKQKKKQHVVVTGGAGYVGAVLVPRLLQENYKVTIFDTFYFGKKSIHAFKDKVRVIQGDVRKPPLTLFHGVDAVIHLAALSNDPTAEFNPIANMEINTQGTKIVAAMAKQAGVKRFILASSCSIYDEGLEAVITKKSESFSVRPRNPYSQSKFLAEQAIQKLATRSFSPIILRKGTIYGYSPRMRYDLIINTMVRDAFRLKKLHIFCQGKQWRPLICIDDVVEAYILALQKPRQAVHNKIINIAADNYRVEDVAKEVQRVFHQSFHTNIELIYEQEKKADRSYCVSTARAKRILGFTAHTSMSSSIISLVSMMVHKKPLQNYANPIFYNIEQMTPILKKMQPLFLGE